MTRLAFTLAPQTENAITEAIENVGLNGLGADGTSEYEIASVDVTWEPNGTFTAVVDCQHVEGKFVSKDELAEMIAGEIGQFDVECSVEGWT